MALLALVPWVARAWLNRMMERWCRLLFLACGLEAELALCFFRQARDPGIVAVRAWASQGHLGTRRPVVWPGRQQTDQQHAVHGQCFPSAARAKIGFNSRERSTPLRSCFANSFDFACHRAISRASSLTGANGRRSVPQAFCAFCVSCVVTNPAFS